MRGHSSPGLGSCLLCCGACSLQERTSTLAPYPNCDDPQPDLSPVRSCLTTIGSNINLPGDPKEPFPLQMNGQVLIRAMRSPRPSLSLESSGSVFWGEPPATLGSLVNAWTSCSQQGHRAQAFIPLPFYGQDFRGRKADTSSMAWGTQTRRTLSVSAEGVWASGPPPRSCPNCPLRITKHRSRPEVA